jgi:hypothetical protein
MAKKQVSKKESGKTSRESDFLAKGVLVIAVLGALSFLWLSGQQDGALWATPKPPSAPAQFGTPTPTSYPHTTTYPVPSFKPTVTQGISPQTKQTCEAGGARYLQFLTSCQDDCATVRALKSTNGPKPICNAVITYGCNCGLGKCWNGATCEPD